MIAYTEGQTFNVIDLAHLVLRDEIDIDNAMLYAESSDKAIDLHTSCRLGDYPSITESDEEVFPDFVTEGALEVLYYGQQFVDVVRNAKLQLGAPADTDLVKALNFYDDHDNFIDF